MRQSSHQLRVFVDLGGVTTFAGAGYVSERRGVVSTSFNYDSTYQANRSAYPISPDLPLTTSSHHVTGLPGSRGERAHRTRV